MDITFEPYLGNHGSGRLRVPLSLRGAPAGTMGLLKLSSQASGSGRSIGAASAELHVRPSRLLASASRQVGLLALPPSRMLGTGAATLKTVTIGSLRLRSTVVAASGHQLATGQGTLSNTPRLTGLGTKGARPANSQAGMGLLHVRQRVLALPPAELHTYVTLAADLQMLSFVGDPRTVVHEICDLGATASPQHVMVRQSALAMAGHAAGGLLDGLEAVQEHLAFDDVVGVVWRLLYQEALALGADATISAGQLVQIAEVLALAAGAGSVLDALEAVVSALELGSIAAHVWASHALEAIALAGGGAAGLLAWNSQTEGLALSADAVGAVTFMALVPEALTLGGAAGDTAELLESIREGVDVLVRVALPDGQYLAWVCNTESKAFTTYRNFPFNSFCELGGHYYGATDEGIYLLEGDDDAGVPIDAHIRGGLMDMGTGRMKRFEAMYLGYRADGQLLLKVVTTSENGEKTESWYSLDAQPAEAMREGRIKIGKGLKSVYWGFEVANVDGGDFELDTIAWLPMVLDRRI